MKRKTRNNQEKLQVVLEGVKGETTISEVCNRYGVSQAQYYKWKDQFLKNASKAFDTNTSSKRESRLENENQRLKAMIGQLTMELKKTEELL